MIRRSAPLLLFAFLLAATSLLAAEPAVPILAYHEVDPTPERGWGVRTEDFDDELALLAKTGYHVIPIADLYDYLSGKRASLPDNPVVITVDDGWACTYTQMQPRLLRYKMPYSLYVYPKIVGQGSHALKWPQIQELQAKGVDVESHTLSHAHLMHRSHADMNDAQYAAFLDSELAESRRIIEEKVGHPVRFLAYPYGDYDAGVDAGARKAGYVVGLLSEVGLNRRGRDPLKLYRFPIVSDTSLEAFRTGLGAATLTLTDLSPAAGSVVSANAKTVRASLPDVARFDPASLHIALLGTTPATGTVDAKTGVATLTATGAWKGERQYAIVWGNDAKTGQRFIGLWTFYTSAAAKQRYEAMQKSLSEIPLHHTQTKRQ